MKFKITTSFIQHGKYIVEGENQEEAEEKFWEGTYLEYEDDNSSVLDSQEEIIEINKI